MLPGLPKKTLVYLDPPYYAKGKDLYENHYKPEDHAAIARIVSDKIRHKWIVSYDNVPEIADLYREHRSVTYCLSYSAADRYSGAEIMFFSDDFVIPDVDRPAKLIFRNGVVQRNNRVYGRTAVGQPDLPRMNWQLPAGSSVYPEKIPACIVGHLSGGQVTW